MIDWSLQNLTYFPCWRNILAGLLQSKPLSSNFTELKFWSKSLPLGPTVQSWSNFIAVYCIAVSENMQRQCIISVISDLCGKTCFWHLLFCYFAILKTHIKHLSLVSCLIFLELLPLEKQNSIPYKICICCV